MRRVLVCLPFVFILMGAPRILVHGHRGARVAAGLAEDLGHAPDAILFNPADDVALKDGVAQISAKNIPAINFINRIDGDFVSFIGGDEFHIGVSAARYFFNAIGGQGNIAIIAGPPGSRIASIVG